MNNMNVSGKVAQLYKANFESYTCTSKEDIPGEVFVANRQSEYWGEVIDLFEDGTFEHYGQFKGQELKFKFKP